MRKTFFLSNPSSITALQIKMDYDDGAIVWINGVRVLDQNEPNDPLYNAIATETTESGTYQTFSINKNIANILVTGNNVIAVQGFNSNISGSDFLIDVELVTAVADTQFSHKRGFYSSPFNLIINSATAGATIRYTLNGSDPRTSSSARTYAGGILIDPNSTTGRTINNGVAGAVIVRAYAFKTDWNLLTWIPKPIFSQHQWRIRST